MADDPAASLSTEFLERYRLTVLPPGDRRDLRLPANVANFLETEVVAAHPPGEYLGAVFVNDMVRPLAYSVPYLGYLRSLRVDAPTFLAPGVVLHAAGLVLFHHRPQRAPEPTRGDVRIAKRVRKAAEAIGLRLRDYLLLGAGGWTSLQDAGHLTARDGRSRVKAKYRNPERPSETWSGRGKMARWLKDKVGKDAKLEDFAVEE